jgi:hypothetical protein
MQTSQDRHDLRFKFRFADGHSRLPERRTEA